ncbi:glucosaminidase domain-containing protein [Pullulanibacillus sp. KACC 23026]|uniref:glucosaminidase domain-containing protein n=1 Tax=Pullulanibacillus sp. KACC 23026 TaxID=3028315 RepID=UPI0023B07625|nr:glucosaminidase domain-containing protein [Pullulanibacillus sp. KACC 23026]WEG14802.1 glucosaminidase domain-containing protein [Pullulanibacillus sp. KACC 23026]
MKRWMTYSALSFALLLMSRTPIALADSGSQLKSQINQLDKKRQSTLNDLQTSKNKLNANQKQQASVMDQVQSLETQIEDSTYKIQVKQNSVDTTKDTIQTLQDNITALKKSISQRKKLIKERARSVYVSGGSNSYLELVLNSANFYELVNRIVFVNKIAQQDQSILKQQVTDNQNLLKDQKALQVTLNQLNEDLKSLEQMKADLNNKKAQEQTILNGLKDKASAIQEAVSEKQKQADLYAQQEAAHKADLSNWQAEQKKAAQAPKASSSSSAVTYQTSASGLPGVLQQFVQSAQQVERSTGVPAAITLAQIELESDAGGQLSQLATQGKNLFGIKGKGPAGTIYLPTHEVIGGIEITINAGFKRYSTYYQSIADHAAVLNQSRYQYFLRNAHNLQDYAYGIQDGGYATDPNYAVKLISVINAYGLGKYDTGSF